MKAIDFGPAFDWFRVLKRVSKVGNISEKDLLQLKDNAARWPTCACGQLCKNLPRYPDGGPLDAILYSKGGGFLEYVLAEDWGQAIAVFQEIEQRVAVLLSETTNNKGTNGNHSE